MKDIIARLFIISPLWVIYFFHENHHGLVREQAVVGTFLVMSLAWWVWLAWMDSGRAPRSSVSVIIRNMGLMYCFLWSFLFLFGPAWFFWYMFAHGTIWLILFGQFVVYMFAHNFIYPYVDPNYATVRKSGWHPFWDVTPFNYDSELIKDGGFEEPVYEDFVPPDHWKHQCPTCGARQQTNFGVCWNCNYGDDGDDTAYQQRWGHIDPSPRPYTETDEDDELPPNQDGFAPVEPRPKP